jgi:hypothetical protein
MVKKDYLKIIFAVIISICTISTIFSLFEFISVSNVLLEIYEHLGKYPLFIPSLIFYVLLVVSVFYTAIIDVSCYEKNKKKLKIILAITTIVLIVITLIINILFLINYYQDKTSTTNKTIHLELLMTLINLVGNAAIVVIITIFTILKKSLYNEETKKDVE